MFGLAVLVVQFVARILCETEQGDFVTQFIFARYLVVLRLEDVNCILSVVSNPNGTREFTVVSNGSYIEGCAKVSKELIKSNNCLLYTSPSPRDATLSRMPSSA